MAITIERNGKEFSFPDNYTQEQIDKFFQDMENPVPVPDENIEAEGEEADDNETTMTTTR